MRRTLSAARIRFAILLVVPLSLLALLSGVQGGTAGSHDSGHASGLEGSRILPQFVGLDDPDRWDVHRPSGLRFRRATRMELAENGWDPGTFLVETGRLYRNAGQGARHLDVLLPLRDGFAQMVEFDLLSSQTGPLAIETRAVPGPGGSTVQVTASTPEFHFYHSEGRVDRRGVDLGGALMLLVSSDGGGVSGHGVVQGIDAEVSGPSGAWVLEEIAVPGKPLQAQTLAKVSLLALPDVADQAWGDCGFAAVCDLICGYLGGPYPAYNPGDDHPCSVPFDPGDPPSGECDDGVDNDGDFDVDKDDLDCDGHGHDAGTPPHFHHFESGRDFGLFGEGKACTEWEGNWKEEMAALAVSTINAFRAENGPLVQPLRWGVISCWIFPTKEAAEECDQDGVCPDFDGGFHVYPYQDASSQLGAYRALVTLDMQHAHALGAGRPLAIGHVLHKGVLFDGPAGYCGESALGDEQPLSGYTVSAVKTDGCLGWKAAVHEIGHAFGVDHEDYPADGLKKSRKPSRPAWSTGASRITDRKSHV